LALFIQALHGKTNTQLPV